VCPEFDAGRPVDPALLAFLSRARSAHHQADQQEAAKDLNGALQPLRAVVDGPRPGGSNPPEEVREVLADTLARLADLESRVGRFDAARDNVRKGLELVDEPNYFRGHLFEVQGLLEQRYADESSKRGDEEQAQKAKQRALEAFGTAMDIQEKVIEQALPDQ
jgi:tetratricopeptide (TPR) repeat protein